MEGKRMSNRQGIFGMVISLFVVGLVLVTTSGCDSAGAGSGGGGSASTASANLSSLPELAVDLPASLSGTKSVSGSSVQITASGDVTGVTAGDLEYAQASGWQVVYEATRPDTVTRIFLAELREFAAEGDLNMDTVYELGNRDTAIGLNEIGVGTMDFGKLKLVGTAEDMTVWWYANPVSFLEVYLKLQVSQVGGSPVVEGVRVYNWLAGAATAGRAEGDQDLAYIYYNRADNEAILAVETNATSSSPELSITRGFRNGDGSTTVLVKRGPYVSDTLTTTEVTVGWGDDSVGGVGVIDENAAADEEKVLREVYNEIGSLVLDSRGFASSNHDHWYLGTSLAEETMFGATYEVARRFMLRELLPLKAEYSTRPLQREETGQWSYPEGDPEITAEAYAYFIDEDNNGARNAGDTDLPIIDGPNYNFDASTGQETAVAVAELITTGTTPVELDYFTGPDFTKIDGMHTKLNTLYANDVPGFGVDVLGAGYSNISGEAAFADLTY
jgi:hypothetical protein